MKNISFLLLIVICNSCRYSFDTRLQIVNNSDAIIYVGVSGEGYRNYNDTAYVYINCSTAQHGDTYKFHPNTVKEFLLYIPWEEAFEDVYGNNILFYVFDATVLETVPWEQVKKEYLVLQRYDLSLQNLIDLNWTLSYPPDERMKDIKMYPPYGSE